MRTQDVGAAPNAPVPASTRKDNATGYEHCETAEFGVPAKPEKRLSGLRLRRDLHGVTVWEAVAAVIAVLFLFALVNLLTHLYLLFCVTLAVFFVGACCLWGKSLNTVLQLTASLLFLFVLCAVSYGRIVHAYSGNLVVGPPCTTAARSEVETAAIPPTIIRRLQESVHLPLEALVPFKEHPSSAVRSPLTGSSCETDRLGALILGQTVFVGLSAILLLMLLFNGWRGTQMPYLQHRHLEAAWSALEFEGKSRFSFWQCYVGVLGALLVFTVVHLVLLDFLVGIPLLLLLIVGSVSWIFLKPDSKVLYDPCHIALDAQHVVDPKRRRTEADKRRARVLATALFVASLAAVACIAVRLGRLGPHFAVVDGTGLGADSPLLVDIARHELERRTSTMSLRQRRQLIDEDRHTGSRATGPIPIVKVLPTGALRGLHADIATGIAALLRRSRDHGAMAPNHVPWRTLQEEQQVVPPEPLDLSLVTGIFSIGSEILAAVITVFSIILFVCNTAPDTSLKSLVQDKVVVGRPPSASARRAARYAHSVSADDASHPWPGDSGTSPPPGPPLGAAAATPAPPHALLPPKPPDLSGNNVGEADEDSSLVFPIPILTNIEKGYDTHRPDPLAPPDEKVSLLFPSLAREAEPLTPNTTALAEPYLSIGLDGAQNDEEQQHRHDNGLEDGAGTTAYSTPIPASTKPVIITTASGLSPLPSEMTTGILVDFNPDAIVDRDVIQEYVNLGQAAIEHLGTVEVRGPSLIGTIRRLQGQQQQGDAESPDPCPLARRGGLLVDACSKDVFDKALLSNRSFMYPTPRYVPRGSGAIEDLLTLFGINGPPSTAQISPESGGAGAAVKKQQSDVDIVIGGTTTGNGRMPSPLDDVCTFKVMEDFGAPPSLHRLKTQPERSSQTCPKHPTPSEAVDEPYIPVEPHLFESHLKPTPPASDMGLSPSRPIVEKDDVPQPPHPSLGHDSLASTQIPKDMVVTVTLPGDGDVLVNVHDEPPLVAPLPLQPPQGHDEMHNAEDHDAKRIVERPACRRSPLGSTQTTKPSTTAADQKAGLSYVASTTATTCVSVDYAEPPRIQGPSTTKAPVEDAWSSRNKPVTKGRGRRHIQRLKRRQQQQS